MARPMLDRRTFLTLAALGVAVPGKVLGAGGAVDDLAESRASIGFIEGSDRWERLAWPPGAGDARLGDWQGLVDLPAADVVVASEIPLGDQDFIERPVRVSLRGIYPEAFPLKGERVKSADLDVMWPSHDPLAPEPIPVFAWSLRLKPGVNVSPPVTQTVPVGPDGQIHLRLRFLPTKLGARELGVPTGVWQEQQVRFTVDWQEGQPKLQRGLYLVGLTPQRPWDAPMRLPGQGDKVIAELRSIVLAVEAVETNE